MNAKVACVMVEFFKRGQEHGLQRFILFQWQLAANIQANEREAAFNQVSAPLSDSDYDSMPPLVSSSSDSELPGRRVYAYNGHDPQPAASSSSESGLPDLGDAARVQRYLALLLPERMHAYYKYASQHC